MSSTTNNMKSYRHYKGNSPQNKKRHWLAALLILLGLGLVLFGALEIVIAIHGRDRVMADPQPEVMVVFGCQMRQDGPSILLRDRLDTALAYWEDHPDIKIIVTGGKGDDEHMSEAQCMYEYLTDHGVDGSRVLLEDRSRNTFQNFRFTRDLLEELGHDVTQEGVLVVSNGFHLTRARMLAGRVGFGDVSTLAAPSTHLPSRIHMFFREPLALVKSFFLDR